MTDQKTIIAAAIAAALKQSKLTQKQIAEVTGKSTPTVSGWVKGRGNVPAVDIAIIAGVTGQADAIAAALIKAAQLTPVAKPKSCRIWKPRQDLRQARSLAGLTIDEAAKALSVSSAYIYRVEAGKAYLSEKRKAAVMAAYSAAKK